jgi:hypothetical protein
MSGRVFATRGESPDEVGVAFEAQQREIHASAVDEGYGMQFVHEFLRTMRRFVVESVSAPGNFSQPKDIPAV